jgi:hypothetical protein
MSRHIPPAWPGPTPTGAARGVPCRRCGHDLRGLSSADRCPNCGAAAGFTLEGELIRYADIEWQRALASGTRLVIAGALVIVGGAMIGLIAVVVELFMPGKPSGRVGLITIVAGLALGYLLSLRGYWKLTRRDPSGAGEARYGRSRRVARWGLVIGVVGAEVGFMRGFAVGAGWTASTSEAVIAEVIIALSTLAVIVGLFAQLDYLRKLIRRLRDGKLAARADFLLYALGVSSAAVQLLQLGSRYFTLAGDRAGAEAVGLITLPAGLAAIIFVVMYMGMLERFGKRLAEERRLAEQTWAAQPAPPAQSPPVHLHPAAPA